MADVDPSESSASPTVPVCGIGASAGGVEALQEFFSAIPANLGLAYVVIVHLAPDRKSELPEILARRTKMPVVQVGDHDKAELHPDHVYVIAPDRKLVITDKSVGASRFEQPRGQRAAIDLFFRSLAEKHGDGYAVVLSGSGSDGTVGARAVKENGGVVLVQDPADAGHGAMPRSVISAGIADVVLPVRELAARLAELAHNKHRLRELQPANESSSDAITEVDEQILRHVLELLRKHTRHDFSRYKRSTMLRRMTRRLELSGQLTMAGYLDHLRAHTEEVRALFNDLLISVTTFFRDSTAWSALQSQIIGPLLEKAGAEEQIRVWVPGCSTGEEAYTIAILFQEEIERRQLAADLVIFASDADENVVATAREGLYPHAISTDVSDSRLQRFFRREDEHYRVVRELRDRVVFAVHNVLRDPPFSRLHLISCRNLLIYLDRDLQRQLMEVFGYALREDGTLLLGASETADEEIFQAIDKRHRIFGVQSRTDGTRPELPEMLTRATTRSRDHGHEQPSIKRPSAEIHVEALEQVGPPSILTDDRGNVIHLSPSAARYLQQEGGPLARRITDLARAELRDELHTLMTRVIDDPGPHLSEFVRVALDGVQHQVAILVARPGDASGSRRVLISFLDLGALPPESAPTHSEAPPDQVRELRERLRRSERRVQAMRDEDRTTTEDLRAANEELQSLNEEYRSTAEELETSKEELQSVNEELQTVNNELKTKVDEISRSHSDLENLMIATDLGTLFLDRELRIKRFTPRVVDLFSIKTRDMDRPIRDITHSLDYDRLEQDARRVLTDVVTIEREAADREARSYMVRMNPYRLANSHDVDGVVITFVDVTAIKAAEAALRQSERRLAEELERMRHLHRITTGVAIAASTEEALEQLLDGAIEMQGADFGSVHLVEGAGDKFGIVAQRGFNTAFLERFRVVDKNDPTTTGRALRSRGIVQVADMRQDAADAPSQDAAAVAGYQAVQSTPLINRNGILVGVLSVHFKAPHAFGEHDTQVGELLGRQAADLIASRIQQDRLARLNEELSERTAELEASQRRLSHQAADLIEQDHNRDEFLAALGHELRNPMAAIHNSIALISSPDPRSQRAIDVLRRQDRHMLRLVNDLLDITRVKHGRIRLEPVVLDIAALARDALDTVRAEADRKGLVLEYASTLQKPIYVDGDPERLAQVLDNLLRNAVTYTDGGKVTLLLESEPPVARIRVRDTGVGIGPEEAQALFKPYQRRPVDQRSGGLGLGLVLVKALVDAHGGTVSYQSGGRDKGSTFSFTVPLAQKPAVQTEPVHPDDGLPSRRVLVVDDQRDVADMLGAYLESLGQDVQVAYDGDTAAELAHTQRPDVAFIDLSMPGMDGLELAQRLRQMYPNNNLALIAITGDTQAGAGVQGTAFSRYLLKPATSHELGQLLRSLPMEAAR